jgi:hypothetical protein
VLHFAAQNYSGYLSLIVLSEQLHGKYNFKFDVDIRSGLLATPLHFAVIFRELKNVELLISLGANLNLQDREGRTPLHIAVIRLCAGVEDDPVECYYEYKIIIKELLFHGASRAITTKLNMTALDILLENEANFTQEQFKSLSFILTDQTTCIFFMRHRPIKKVSKSPYLLILAILINLVVAYLFYIELNVVKSPPTLWPEFHYVFVYTSLAAFVFIVPTFVLSAAIDPGYLVRKYEFS